MSVGPVSVPPWRTGSTPSGSTRHSARCRSRGSRTPRWAGPGSSVPSTPTCGWSGSWRSRSSCATPASRVSSTPRPRGSRCACSSTARGVSPRTSSSPRNGPRRRRSGPSASPARWRRSPASGSTVPPSRCTTASSGLRLPGRPVRRADRGQGRAAGRPVAAAARGPRRGPCRGRGCRGAGEQVLRGPGRHLDAPAAGPHRAVAHRDDRRPRRRRVRDHELARPAGGPGLRVPHRHRLGLGRRAGPVARAGWPRRRWPRRSSRAGTTW